VIQTDYGSFDGTSWERLCQLAFKQKFGTTYQHMPKSPGDFGLEGWTTDGLGFQCYCPEKHYTQSELYDAIRDKITEDVGKLKLYAAEIAERLGSTKIQKWLLVTPVVEHNKLHRHARKKEGEARAWGISILTDDFTIYIQDGGFYASEFEQCRRNEGASLQLGPALSPVDVLKPAPEAYEQLIDRKNRARLLSRSGSSGFEAALFKLNQITGDKFLRCDHHLATIERASPQAYYQIIRIIGHYAEELEELAYTWAGEASELVDEVKAQLCQRIESELAGRVTFSDANKIADLVVSRWLAVCQLDFAEAFKS
jgi:hypothetical protein